MNIAIAALAIASSPLFCASLSAIPTAEREVLDCLPGHTFAAHQNWENTDDVTALGTGMQVLTGVFNLDLLADIRDNWHNVMHWSDVSTAQKIIDSVGLLPVIGAIKYADEVGDVIKGGNRAADAASAAAKAEPKLLGPGTQFGAKIEGQLAGRGWTKDLVQSTIDKPARTVPWTDTRHLPGGGRMNDPATVYYGQRGGYVVRNNRTGDIIQVSDRTDPGWIAPWD